MSKKSKQEKGQYVHDKMTELKKWMNDNDIDFIFDYNDDEACGYEILIPCPWLKEESVQ